MLHDIILFFAGILVGSVNAVAGGGMLIGFPILLALGMPALIANATGNLVVLPGNISATFGYRKYLNRVPKTYLVLLIPAIIGSALGALVLRHTSSTKFTQIIPGLIIFAAILFAFQPYLYRKIHKHIHSVKGRKMSFKTITFISFAILPVCFYGGYFGPGFGFIMLAFLGFTGLHNHIHRMNTLKCIIGICIASTSLIVLYSSHLINWRQGLIMGTGNLFGGYYGALGIQKVSTHT
ncbi:MAG TPA: sulfite exporter TauE/SafE family protein, partial [Patescibacteria group bacterium]|nr:sulfite exporter TauE/SafE family protein [Patescibacteria group bacterium]